jgi:hypothetical protein
VTAANYADARRPAFASKHLADCRSFDTCRISDRILDRILDKDPMPRNHIRRVCRDGETHCRRLYRENSLFCIPQGAS